jgi:hypothetical protein
VLALTLCHRSETCVSVAERWYLSPARRGSLVLLLASLCLFLGCTTDKRPIPAAPASFLGLLESAKCDTDVFKQDRVIPLRTPDSLFVGEIIHLTTWSGGFALIDRANAAPLVFDSSGHYLGMIGRRGSGPGEFENATSLAFDSHRNVWLVADSRLFRISTFSLEGRFLSSFKTSSGVSELGLLETAGGIRLAAFTPKARTSGLVVIFDEKGEKVADEFTPSKQIATFPFNIACAGMLVQNGRVYAAHYLSSVIGVYSDGKGSLEEIPMMGWRSYAPPKYDDLTSPVDFMSSFTGVTKILQGPYRSVIVQYARSGSDRVRGESFIGFVDMNGIALANGIQQVHPYYAAENDGRCYSIRYPVSSESRDNPSLVRWKPLVW